MESHYNVKQKATYGDNFVIFFDLYSKWSDIQFINLFYYLINLMIQYSCLISRYIQ